MVKPHWLEIRDRELYCKWEVKPGFKRKGDRQPDTIFPLEGCSLHEGGRSDLILKS